MIRLSKIVKEGEEPKRFSNEVKKHFLEIVSTYNKYQEMMDRKSDITEIAETLGGITDAARELAVNEADDWFDAHTVKRNMNELTKLGKAFDQVAVEAKNLDQRLHGLYEDMGHILSRYYKIGEISEEQMKERLGLREDGKLQGGEKDPCWKGYEMIGMKPGKGGSQVPNCVPKNESVNEAIGNDKAMLALVDMLSNSMEHYASANEFVNITSKIPGFANNKAELKDVFAKYYKVGARERNDWNTKDWLKWLKQWPLEESKTNCVECGKVNEEAKPILKPGTKVKLRGGKSGKIVRFDGKTPGSPFYIVDIGQYYSIEVPAHELETESVSEAMQSGSWVGFTKTQKGKKYHDTFSSGKQAQQWAIKNNGGAMPKSEWDSKEAKYAVKEAAYGYKDSTASYIDKHKEEFKAAEKMNKGNEQSFYDSLSALEEKLGHPKYMIFLSNALRGYKVDMYKDPKIKNQQEAEEALFLLSK